MSVGVDILGLWDGRPTRASSGAPVPPLFSVLHWPPLPTIHPPLPHSRPSPALPRISESTCGRFRCRLAPRVSFWDPHRGGPHLNSTDGGGWGGGGPADPSHSPLPLFSFVLFCIKQKDLFVDYLLVNRGLPSRPDCNADPGGQDASVSLRLPSRAWYELCPPSLDGAPERLNERASV